MESIYELFSAPVRNRIMNIDLLSFQEIRLRVNRGMSFCCGREKWWLTERGGLQRERRGSYIFTEEDMMVFLESCSEHSLYAYAGQMKQGYLTIRGGHRIGFSGTLICEDGKINGFGDVGSANLRIAHEVKSCAKSVLCRIFQDGRFCNTLILSPPGGGKTTLLRDMIRVLSDGSEYAPPFHVAVADERGEIGACYSGCPSFDLGSNTDVMDGGSKAETIWMMLRSLGPEIIAMDEIGGREEAEGISCASRWGIGLLASMHGTVTSAPWKQMKLEFERYIEPVKEKNGWSYRVYDQNGRCVCENCRNFSDCSRNPDSRQRMGKTKTGMCE